MVGQGWTNAGTLKFGDMLFSLSKGRLKVTQVADDPEPKFAYNFEVSQNHNYQVGELGVEAHNAPFDWKGPFWTSLKPFRGGARTNGNLLYYKDNLHGDLECFNRKTKKHLGSFDPTTGTPTKPPVIGRPLPLEYR